MRDSEAGPVSVVGSDLGVFRAVYPSARRFAAFVAPAGMEPDDLVQEALARVLAKGGLVELSEPLAYLRTTMLNLVRNEHRRRGREHRALARLGAADDGSVDEVDRHAGSSSVVDVLGLLPPVSRALVFLVDLEGCSAGEAAEWLGLSVTAARARLSRARRDLRRQLELHEGVDP